MNKGLSIQILMCYKIFGTETWSNKNRSAPFWRLYWNANEGASLILGTKEVSLGPDKIVLIPPETSFDKRTECEVHHFFIHFTLSYESGQLQPGLYELPITKEILSNIQESISLFNAGLTDSPRFPILTNLIVAQSLYSLSESIKAPAVDNPRLLTVFQYMEQHIGEKLVNADLAHLLGMNTNAFIHFFKQKTKTTPKKYLEMKRFQRACNLLQYSNISIDHIAEQTGFCDRNHFTRAFTRLEKMGPAEFRKKSEFSG